MITTSIQSSRVWGGKNEHIENIMVTILMLLITIAYEFISALLIPDFQFNWFEFIGTWSGLITVWLVRTQNILCWPWGVVSALALGYFFKEIDLTGQQWLNWGYFLVIQFWAWTHWVNGTVADKQLPVTRLSLSGRIYTGVAIILGTVFIFKLIDLIAPGSQYPVLDSVVVASSIVAQYLLGRKKFESWFLWLGPVNLLSITLFYFAGAYTVMALYVAFFIHAYFALLSWKSSAISNTK